MIPEKMNMNQHSNASKEKSSKKIANRFNLQKKGEIVKKILINLTYYQAL